MGGQCEDTMNNDITWENAEVVYQIIDDPSGQWHVLEDADDYRKRGLSPVEAMEEVSEEMVGEDYWPLWWRIRSTEDGSVLY